MKLVMDGGSKRIGEDGDGFVEGDAMLLRLAAALAGSNSKLRGGKFIRWLWMPL